MSTVCKSQVVVPIFIYDLRVYKHGMILCKN